MINENYTINYDQLTDDSFQSLNEVEPPDYEDDASSIKSEETIRRLVETLMDRVQEVVNTSDLQVVNEFDCPMGCEESSHRWQYLFYGSLLANTVLALLIVAFVCVISRRDRVDESEILMPIKKKNRRSTASDNE